MAKKPEKRPAILHDDGLARCPWPGVDPLYVAYHDNEWGVPEYDSRALFEKLILDGFQAGLSWITILRKRDNFRKAFDRFEPAKIARYKPAKIEKLMADEGIVRNRQKVEGAVLSARAWLKIEEKEGFSNFLWKFVDGVPVQGKLRDLNDIQAETETSRKMSKAPMVSTGPPPAGVFSMSVVSTNFANRSRSSAQSSRAKATSSRTMSSANCMSS